MENPMFLYLVIAVLKIVIFTIKSLVMLEFRNTRSSDLNNLNSIANNIPLGINVSDRTITRPFMTVSNHFYHEVRIIV
jgi:hypothetical protein